MTMIDGAWRWMVGVALSGVFACANEPDTDVEPVPELVCEEARLTHGAVTLLVGEEAAESSKDTALTAVLSGRTDQVGA